MKKSNIDAEKVRKMVEDKVKTISNAISKWEGGEFDSDDYKKLHKIVRDNAAKTCNELSKTLQLSMNLYMKLSLGVTRAFSSMRSQNYTLVKMYNKVK
jgi:hypothetical protein